MRMRRWSAHSAHDDLRDDGFAGDIIGRENHGELRDSGSWEPARTSEDSPTAVEDDAEGLPTREHVHLHDDHQVQRTPRGFQPAVSR